MKKIYLVIQEYDDRYATDQVAAAETVDKANQIADLVPGSYVEEFAIQLYEAGETPHMVEVFWASYIFDPARDENRHPLASRPGRLTIKYGSETGLDAHVSDPEIYIHYSLWDIGFIVNATGYRDQETAGSVAADRFNLELARRGLSVHDTEM